MYTYILTIRRNSSCDELTLTVSQTLSNIIISSSNNFSIHPPETSSRQINSLDLVSRPYLTFRDSKKKKEKK